MNPPLGLVFFVLVPAQDPCTSLCGRMYCVVGGIEGCSIERVTHPHVHFLVGEEKLGIASRPARDRPYCVDV